MVIEQTIHPVKKFFMKIGKKNLMIIGAALLVCAAVCLNVILFSGGNDDSYKGYDEPSGITGENSGENTNTESASDNYFASVQVSRKRARDEAMEVLQSVAASAGADEATVNQALSEISKLAMAIEQESNIETLIMAKGFEQCVAVINGDTARIVVSETQLTQAQIAQINEIVYEQANILPVNITITEKGE